MKLSKPHTTHDGKPSRTDTVMRTCFTNFMTVASWPFECHEFYQLSAYSVFFRRVVVELLTEATKYDSCLMTGNVQRVGS